MIRIGDFSRLSQAPVKTLRYYDELGLLKPAQTDPFTGYRMYEYHQLLRLNRILALKDLGFSLVEIGQLLRENLTAEQLRGMLKLRRAEARQRVLEEAERLDRVETRLRQIEQEDSMSTYDIVIKQIEPLKVGAVRGVVPTPPEQGTLWIELEEYLKTQPVRCIDPCLTLYHDEEYKERDWDLEVCQAIEGQGEETGRVKVRTLPAVPTMACVLHHGPLTRIGEAYDALMKWIDANGYRICGQAREISLQVAMNPERGAVLANQADPDTILDVQFPVERVK